MENPKVSIIIPVYNSANYLEKCLNSILHQDYKNIEIILVNDGSTDKSREIIEKYERSNPCVVSAFHIRNAGVSNARNVGIKKSSGELVTFVDPDDFISKTYITNLVEPFYKKSDIYCMSIGNFSLVYDNNSKIKKIDCSVVENIQAKELLDRLATSKGGGYVWNKMFRRDLLDKNKISFDTNATIMEDFLFCVQYLNSCTNYQVAISKDYGYYYYQRSSSTVHVSKREESKIVVLEKILNISKEYPVLNLKMQIEYANHVVSVAFFSDKASRKYFKDIYQMIICHSQVDYLTNKHKCMLLLGCILPEVIPIFKMIKK